MEYGFFDVKDDWFPSFGKKNEKKLFNIMMFIRTTDDIVRHHDFVFTIPGILLSVLHIIILSRKDMRKSSINVIMIGLAVYDIFIMIDTTRMHYMENIGYYRLNCHDVKDYFFVYSQIFFITFKDFVMRCTLWLALLMIVIRTISLANATNKRFDILSTSKCGLFSIFVTTFISLGLSIWRACYYDIYTRKINHEEEDEYYYSEGLPRCELNRTLNYDDDPVVIRWYLTIQSVTAYIFPCVAFPILTSILVYKFRKNRPKAGIQIGKQVDKADRATVLVIFIAVSFIIAELPKGCSRLLAAYFYDDDGIWIIADSLVQIFDELSILIAATRGLVCYLMSTQYRTNTKLLFKCAKNQKIRFDKTRSTSRSSSILRRNATVKMD